MDTVHPDYNKPDLQIDTAFDRWLNTPLPSSGFKPRELITVAERNVARQAFYAGFHAGMREA